MEFKIEATEEEKIKVVNAIRRLNKIAHLNYMSYSMFEEECDMSQTKVRIVLQDLMDAGFVEQIATNGDKKVKRYYYVITEPGKKEFPL